MLYFAQNSSLFAPRGAMQVFIFKLLTHALCMSRVWCDPHLKARPLTEIKSSTLNQVSHLNLGLFLHFLSFKVGKLEMKTEQTVSQGQSDLVRRTVVESFTTPAFSSKLSQVGHLLLTKDREFILWLAGKVRTIN